MQFISQLHFYVPNEVQTQIRMEAKQAKLPLSKYLAELVKRETQAQNQWRPGYFYLFDALQDRPQNRPVEIKPDYSTCQPASIGDA